jgi:hypothetical protein
MASYTSGVEQSNWGEGGVEFAPAGALMLKLERAQEIQNLGVSENRIEYLALREGGYL